MRAAVPFTAQALRPSWAPGPGCRGSQRLTPPASPRGDPSLGALGCPHSEFQGWHLGQCSPSSPPPLGGHSYWGIQAGGHEQDTAKDTRWGSLVPAPWALRGRRRGRGSSDGRLPASAALVLLRRACEEAAFPHGEGGDLEQPEGTPSPGHGAQAATPCFRTTETCLRPRTRTSGLPAG